MANEFHHLDLSCVSSSVIPSGLNYTDVHYQSCAGAGSVPGQLTIDGDTYLASKYGFYYDNLWRNFGIVILFNVAFVAIHTILSEVIEWNDGSAGAVSYCGRKNSRPKRSKQDEENKAVDVDYKAPPASTDSGSEITNAGIAKTQSAFAWRKLKYTIQQENSDRVLLNGVSGYCRPGQLTALVGSSGAGKSTCM